MFDIIQSSEQETIECTQCGTVYYLDKEIGENVFESDEYGTVLEVDYPYFHCGNCNCEMVAEEEE